MEIHYTPKHGILLDVAEIGLIVLKSQCLNRSIPDLKTLAQEIDSWVNDHNRKAKPLQWHFTTKDAREKLLSIYQKI